MKKYEKIKHEIIGSVLKQIYRAQYPENKFWLDGIGNLLYYRYVMELNNGKKYEFYYDHISVWDESEKLFVLKTDLEHNFRNKRIVDVIEDDIIFFKTENEMILFHDICMGSELVYKKYMELFDENDQLI